MSDSSINIKDVLTYALIGGVAYAVYLLVNAAGKGAGAAANWTSGQIADLLTWWNQLAVSPPMTALGNVNLPNGQSFPVNSLALRTDGTGAVYFQTLDGSVWQIASGADMSGNWSASIVPPPNFGVTGTTW